MTFLEAKLWKTEIFWLVVNGYVPHPFDPLIYGSFVPQGKLRCKQSLSGMWVQNTHSPDMGKKRSSRGDEYRKVGKKQIVAMLTVWQEVNIWSYLFHQMKWDTGIPIKRNSLPLGWAAAAKSIRSLPKYPFSSFCFGNRMMSQVVSPI